MKIKKGGNLYGKIRYRQKTNTLVKCNRSMMWKRLNYLIIPHQYKGKQIDRIGPHCFDYLMINLLCIEESVEYLDDEACENSHIYNVKLPRGLKIGKRCFAGSQLKDILLPRSLHIIKECQRQGICRMQQSGNPGFRISN